MRKYILLLAVLLSITASAQHTDTELTDYWIDFDVESDSAIVHALEGMAGFAELVPQASSPHVVAKAYLQLMARAEHKAELWYCLRDNAEETFYGPNATCRNDEVYLLLLDTFLSNSHSTEGDKIRFSFQQENLSKNRVGTRAADLLLHMDDNGRKCLLSELCQGADSVFLLFYDPLCDHCGQLINELKSDTLLQQSSFSDQMRFIAVDIAPRRSWLQRFLGVKKKNPHAIPSRWIRTEDRKGQVMDDMVYHLPFVPQLYILGRNMTVVKK